MAIVDWYNDDVNGAGSREAPDRVPVGNPEPDEHHAHQQQTGDLDHVDRYGGHGRPVDAPVSDVAHDARKTDSHDGQRQVGQRVVEDRRVQIAEQRRRVRHHDPGIDPVVEVADPAHAELGEARVPLVSRALLVQEGRLCEVVARAGAGVRVDPGQLRIAVRGQHRQDQGKKEAGPHPVRCRGAVARQRGLSLERRPQEGAWRN